MSDQSPNWNWSNEAEGRLGAPVDPPGWFCGHRLATWPFRVMAGLIDYGLTFFLPYGCLGGTRLAWAVCITLSLANSGFLAAYTSQSLGKRVVGIKMVWVKKGRDNGLYVVPVPVIVGLLRVVLHALDYAFCCIGFFLPLVNKSKGTFADYLTRCLNFRDPRLPRAEHGVVGVADWVG